MTHTVDEHAAVIERMLAPVLDALGTERVALSAALGRLTAADCVSAYDLPLFRNSQMDGFAVRASDVMDVPVTLRVIGGIAAGDTGGASVVSGTAVRIMTGAPVPDGADAVVPIEHTDATPSPGGSHASLDATVVTVLTTRASGDYVRDKGSDLRAGDLLVASGTRLAPRHLAALASAGHTSVEVRRRARVAVLATGAELARDAEMPEAGQIFDSNSVALEAAIVECGAEASLVARSGDDPVAFGALLTRATDASDLVITSGGISQGDYEVVRQALEALGADAGASVGSVAMQPGGPQATAVVDGTAVVCFPGNPVSTQVSFAVFVAPLLRRAAGLPPAPELQRTLVRAVASPAGKRQFLRGALVGADAVEQVGGPGSHLVAAMARADVLIDVPAEVTDLPAGACVRVLTL